MRSFVRISCGLVAAIALGAGCASDQKHDKGVPLSMSDLPARVQSTFRRDYPHVKVNNIVEKEDDHVTRYEINVTQRDGSTRTIEYNREGDPIQERDLNSY